MRNRRIYIGSRACKDLILDGLERLEYRGYDSAGIALVDTSGVEVVRAVGNVARLRAAAGRLPHATVVTTTMTNLGFRRAMGEAGITVCWTDVGDRYVLAEMRGGGFVPGGEQSGHVINLAHGPTGDGLAAGIQLLGAVGRRGRPWPRPRG